MLPAPLSSLLSCHERVRTFTAGLRRLVAAGPDDLRVPGAAAMAWRYFAVGLPLHAQDEDESLAPLLLDADPALAPLLDDLRAQHAAMDATLAGLLPLLDALSREERINWPELGERVERLCGQLLPHIEREEAELFPRCALLSPADCEAIGAEIVARRRAA